MTFNIRTSFGYLVQKSAILLRRKINEQLAKEGVQITVEEYTALATIKHDNGITSKDLSLLLEKDKTVVSRLVTTLEKKAYVSKQASINDGRVYNLYLTSVGEAVYKKTTKIVEEIHREAKMQIGEETYLEMVSLLETAISYLE